jgi:hypothetical protein
LQQEGEAADIITAPTAAIAKSSLLLQLPLPKKNDEKKIVQTSIISAHNCQAGDRLQSSWSTTMM